MEATVGTRDEWLAARVELLEQEKELTRRSDALAKRRRELPWVRTVHIQFTRAATTAVLVIVALALAACGGGDTKDSEQTHQDQPSSTAPAAKQAGSTIDVPEGEYTLEATPASGKAGKLTFNVANDGAIDHEFVIIKTDRKAGDLLKGSEADESGAVDEIANIAPGKSVKLTVKLRPGHYALICNLPGHYRPGGKPGMSADFTVR